MRSLFLLMTTLLFAAVPALAQETPRAEVFGGYQYQSLNAGAQIALSTSPSALTAGGNGCEGFGAGVAYNLNEHFGAVGDVGACWETGLVTGLRAHDVNFLFGPRASFRSNAKVSPFVQVLLGGQYSTVRSGTSSIGSATSFAMTVGGGADFRLTSHIALRGQAEYLYTKFTAKNQNSARIELGVVYRWGSRYVGNYARVDD